MSDDVRRALEAGGRLILTLAETESDRVARVADEVARRFSAKGRLLAAGNGGSAADAQHVATELSGRFFLDRPPLDAIALNTNSSAVTAIGNDFGFDEVFARQVRAHGRAGDVLLLFTTSGASPNILSAAEAARDLGLYVVGFTGSRGAAFAEACDEAFIVPSAITPRIQEGHIALAHALCERVEVLLFGSAGDPDRATT